jgi:hypothetical protein
VQKNINFENKCADKIAALANRTGILKLWLDGAKEVQIVVAVYFLNYVLLFVLFKIFI